MHKYIALMRGINVGGNKKVEMKRLKALFESFDCHNVSTYINSGNVLFESGEERNNMQNIIEANIKTEFGFAVPTLVKTKREIEIIAEALPAEWQNDAVQKTDICFLFPEINDPKIIDELAFNREYIDIRYIDGAIYWNVNRNNYNKSRLNKLISNTHFPQMTVRNVNTVRYLAAVI